MAMMGKRGEGMAVEAGKGAVHCWEPVEVTLSAQKEYDNPYMDVDVWVDLKGPGFEKRVYGFWDGGNTFRVRLVAMAPGEWSYVSGSNQKDDEGLCALCGSFRAVAWSEEEKQENPVRRGFVKATQNGKAFAYQDGTPFFLLADSWWGLPSYRTPWYDDEQERPVGPGMGFKDVVRYRRRQGYNSLAFVAAHPTWANDGQSANLIMNDGHNTVIRSAWRTPGTDFAKDMHNEGGRPFLFPGHVKGYEHIVPDFTRINPAYYQAVDKRIAYMNEQGMIPFMEIMRRDVSHVWKKYGGWPNTYERYIQQMFARYQAYNMLLSPIHFDCSMKSIDSYEYNGPINKVVDTYGPPAFGTLLGTNAAPATIDNWGDENEQHWLTFHQLGNWREHDHLWYISEMWRDGKPTVNGEPYCTGFPVNVPRAESALAALYCRSMMYGGLLSGALGGYFNEMAGCWGSDIEPEAEYRLWDGIVCKQGVEATYLLAFMEKVGDRLKDLIPCADMVTPNKAGPHLGWTGWAYCAYLPGKEELLLYFEHKCPAAVVRRVKAYGVYELHWFNPRTGEWVRDEANLTVKASQEGRVTLPFCYKGNDWALYMKLVP